MPTIQGTSSVALSSVNDNVLQGSQFEFMPYNGRIDFGLNGDANYADLRVDVYSGTDVILENAVPGSQNRMPVWPDDFSLSDVARQGERIKVRVRNLSAAAARTLFYSCRITPIV